MQYLHAIAHINMANNGYIVYVQEAKSLCT